MPVNQTQQRGALVALCMSVGLLVCSCSLEKTGSTADAGQPSSDTEVLPTDSRANPADMAPPELDSSIDASLVDATRPDQTDDLGTSGPTSKSPKRGIAYGFDSPADLEVLSPGVSWWYNWSPSYNPAVADVYAEYKMDWVPMTWNGNNPDQIRAFLAEHPEVRYLLTYNEPNFSDQANMTPAFAASIWPIFEAIAEEFNVELVGPAVNYCGGCVVVDGEPIANDYIVWLDMFFEAYRMEFGREPRMDYTALHWYDFGLQEQVDRIIERYGKPVWVTEFALWRSEDWNTAEFEQNWLIEVVSFLEAHPMVHRYAWFTGRRPDFPRINLLGGDGELTPLGRAYIDAPF